GDRRRRARRRVDETGARACLSLSDRGTTPVVRVAHDLDFAPSRVLDQPADPAGLLLVRFDGTPLVEGGRENQVLIGDLVHGALERPAEGATFAVAVGVEPDPVEPELEWDLEDSGKALFRVCERLHPRRRVAVLLVPAPRGDKPVAGLGDDLEQVCPPPKPAVVPERRPQADTVAAEILADQLRGPRQLLTERNRRRLREHGLRRGAVRPVAHIPEDDVAVGVLL